MVRELALAPRSFWRVAFSAFAALPVGRECTYRPVLLYWKPTLEAGGGTVLVVVNRAVMLLAVRACTPVFNAAAVPKVLDDPAMERFAHSLAFGKVSKVMTPLPVGPTEMAASARVVKQSKTASGMKKKYLGFVFINRLWDSVSR